jgi:hypothetical protein
MATQTLIQIVQSFAAERGLPVPSAALSSSDRQIVQIVGLLQAFNRDLITRKAFQANSVEALWTMLAAENQGSIDTIAPSGFEGILLETVYDRTLRLPLAGGVSPSEWQTRKALNFTGPLYRFRLRNGNLLMNPAPTAGHILAFEYFSSWFVKDAGGTLKKFWTADTDYSIMGDDLPLAYLSWAWPAAKGFEYAEAFTAYERMIASKLNRDNAPEVARLDGTSDRMQPGVVVSPGSWPLP